jgi:hypothetical protein
MDLHLLMEKLSTFFFNLGGKKKSSMHNCWNLQNYHCTPPPPKKEEIKKKNKEITTLVVIT